MRPIVIAAVLLLQSAPGSAEAVLSEVTGNWGGLEENGFWFRARLSDDGGKARLQIWNGDLLSEPRMPTLDVPNIVWRSNLVEDGEQRLEAVVSGNGTALIIMTETSDEQYTARENLVISYIDNQFTVVGYFRTSADINTGQDIAECDVDVWNDKAVFNGIARTVKAVDFEAKNAALWTATSAVDLGYCPPPA